MLVGERSSLLTKDDTCRLLCKIRDHGRRDGHHDELVQRGLVPRYC